MRLTQAIIRAEQVKGNQIATLCDARKTTWSDFRNQVAKMAAVMKRKGLAEGDRVALLGLNSDYYLQAMFAIAWAGGVMVALNTRWSPQENIYACNDAGTSMLIVDKHFSEVADQLQREVESIGAVFHLGDGPTASCSEAMENLMSDLNPIPDVGRGYDDLAAIFYTGGTTGHPKGVMLSHQNLVSNALCNLTSLSLNQDGVIYLHAAPMFHLADVALSLANMMNGNAHAFIERFSTTGFMRAIEQYKATHALLVPTMISMLVNDPALEDADMSSLRTFYYGASPMTQGTLKQAMKKLPGVEFCQAYGQTELSPIVTVLGPEYHCFQGELAGKASSAGQCNIGCEIKIVDNEGNELPVGTIGEVAATGPNVMLGYWKNPEQTAKALVDGWVLTGDAGYLDEDGFLFLVDRKKDMIVSGGENVFSAEVENVISTHEAVNEVVVIGIPDEKWGEAVHAIVRLMPDEDVSEDTLIQYCKGQIAGYKCPRSVEFRTKPFPMTGAGKIQKNEIRAPYWPDSIKRI
jgi:acyl-CoA synthetase (AMP-forming)/AMP-acid ligase II